MKKSLRILIAADSMALPRPGTPYEDTWIHMLKMKFPGCDIIDRAERGASTERLVTAGGGGVDLLEMYTPDIVILQLGMMDAAPRLFRKTGFEYWFLQKVLPARFRKRYIDYIKKHRGRRPEITEVSPERFRANITSYFERSARLDCKVIALLLAKPNRYLLAKSPHAHLNIEKYNAIYREVASSYPNVMLVVPFDEEYDYDSVMIDELHHNGEGARVICGKLEKAVKIMAGIKGDSAAGKKPVRRAIPAEPSLPRQ